MSSKWIAIIVVSLLGAALLGILIQMLGNPSLLVSDDGIPSPATKEKPGQSTTGSTLEKPAPKESTLQEPVPILSSKTTPSTESVTSESAPQEPVQILSSQTTPIPEETPP